MHLVILCIVIGLALSYTKLLLDRYSHVRVPWFVVYLAAFLISLLLG